MDISDMIERIVAKDQANDKIADANIDISLDEYQPELPDLPYALKIKVVG